MKLVTIQAQGSFAWGKTTHGAEGPQTTATMAENAAMITAWSLHQQGIRVVVACETEGSYDVLFSA